MSDPRSAWVSLAIGGLLIGATAVAFAGFTDPEQPAPQESNGCAGSNGCGAGSEAQPATTPAASCGGANGCGASGPREAATPAR